MSTGKWKKTNTAQRERDGGKCNMTAVIRCLYAVMTMPISSGNKPSRIVMPDDTLLSLSPLSPPVVSSLQCLSSSMTTIKIITLTIALNSPIRGSCMKTKFLPSPATNNSPEYDPNKTRTN